MQFSRRFGRSRGILTLVNRRHHYFFPLVAILGLLWLAPEVRSAASAGNAGEDKVCDSLADYFLGMEDYPQAIRRHVRIIKEHPNNALAHYHLGFAYGLSGRHREELREYRKAIDLGLSDWEVFLNLGLLYMESGNLRAASDVLQLATLLAPARSETHFNLGLIYERRAMLAQAQQELLVALRLDPGQADARNTLGVIYAEQGDYVRAREEWGELINADPGYEPARSNLSILEHIQQGDFKAAQGEAGFAHR